MRNTIAGVTLLLASLVCVVLMVCIERPSLGVPTDACGNTIPYGVCFGMGGTGYPPRPYEPPGELPDANDESVKAINAVLDCRDVRLDIDDKTTFADLIRMIRAELHRLEMPEISIDLDMKAFGEVGEIRYSMAVAQDCYFEHTPMRLRSILSRLFRPLDLTYMIRDETLLFTTIDESRKEPERLWDMKQYDNGVRKWEEEIKNMKHMTDPDRIYKKSMKTYKMLLACLAIAWFAYFVSGLCFLVFAKDKSFTGK
jgi:hypothetical protein